MIRYHGGPITPTSVARDVWNQSHALISFAYPEQLPLAAEVSQSFILDNGAFTLWKRGAGRVDGALYCDWVRQWIKHPGFDWCLIPDVIDGTEDDNDTLMNDWPLRREVSVPVWHMHESLERLERLLQWPRIAIGSSGEFSSIGTALWWLRMDEAMRVLCDSNGCPKTPLHGLRQMNPTVFSHIPYKSVDSASIAINIGIDQAWKGTFQPLTKGMRALVLQDRFENHAAANRWTGRNMERNEELVG